MTAEEMIEKIKKNLKIDDSSRDLIISDVVIDAINYCHILVLDEKMEPILRRKVNSIIAYEEANGMGYIQEVKSITEGDTTISYVTDGKTKDSIYYLNNTDKRALKRWRRLSW